ncbi:hypothetical protein HOLleu_39411 [Holothuria leucospilota]|uniref:Uncharacterized protein n=1 Tax=Holothuria leucospilota TaxID=206669 RepID=A0A9Q1BEU9_HOLLE|nr:hypothetical protein HOLleu_39411 [Holothuria leucospilota]
MEDENVADFGDGVEHGAGEVDPAKHVAAFLIGIRERFKIPHEACNFVASEVRDIIELSTSHLTARVISALQIANVDPAAVNLDDVVNDHSWQNSFDYYSDARHLNAFIAEKFDFVEPVEYVLGRGVNGKDRCMQYVSIIDTLKALLRKDEVFAEVLNGHCSQDGLILDFCDGLHCKSNASLSEHQSLQIQLYSDDFCVANPLGNKVKKLKFSAYYFILGNLSPKFRSKLNMIQLACLCPTEYVKEYGLENVLAPLVRDLKSIEVTGIEIERDGVKHTFTGSLSMIVTDNLAAHSIGGFQESFNTLRSCRFCHVTKTEVKTHLRTSPESRRTEMSYNQQARICTANPDMAGIYGIKSCSVFNSLRYFHVVNGLPSDIAHDLFEGVVPVVLEKVILHCVQSGYFTLEELNNKVECFPYDGSDLVNKPSKMKTDVNQFKVKQTAVQCWCFLRLFPVMFGSVVPVDDKIWSVLLLLADVVELATTTKVTSPLCHFMADVTESFLVSFKKFSKESGATLLPDLYPRTVELNVQKVFGRKHLYQPLIYLSSESIYLISKA